jgi:hypothetical protein
MSKNRKRGSHAWDGARARPPAEDDAAPSKAGSGSGEPSPGVGSRPTLSSSKAVVLERADCCLACIKRSRSRWGKHPDKKPTYKCHRRNAEAVAIPEETA